MMRVSPLCLSVLLVISAYVMTCSGQRVIELAVVPLAIALDAAGDIFVCDMQSDILHFSNNGTLINTFTNTTDTWDAPFALAVLSDGSMVYYTDGFRVIALDTHDGYVTAFNVSTSLSPNAIAVDPSGYVYVAYNANKKIVKYTQNGIPQHTFDINDNTNPNGASLIIAFDGKGNLYWADTTPKVNIISYPLYTDGGSISWSQPNSTTRSLAVGATGEIYATAWFGNFLVNVSGNGSVVQQLTYPSFQPASIAVDSQGNVYAIDGLTSRIVVFSPTQDTVTSSTGLPTDLSSSAEYRYSSTGNGAVSSYVMRLDQLALFFILSLAASSVFIL